MSGRDIYQLVVLFVLLRRIAVHPPAPPGHVPVPGGRRVRVYRELSHVQPDDLTPASGHLHHRPLDEAGHQGALGDVEVGVGRLVEGEAGHARLDLQLEDQLVEADIQGEAGDVDERGLVGPDRLVDLDLCQLLYQTSLGVRILLNINLERTTISKMLLHITQ